MFLHWWGFHCWHLQTKGPRTQETTEWPGCPRRPASVQGHTEECCLCPKVRFVMRVTE